MTSHVPSPTVVPAMPSAGGSGARPVTAASFPIAQTSKPAPAHEDEDEDEDEWEYEYSTTETETYYVTMDLSHPGMFDKVKDTFHGVNRGGYRQWFNPLYADPNKNTQLRPTKTNAMLFAEDKDDDDDDDEENLEPREDDENDNADGHVAANGTNSDKEKTNGDSHEGEGTAINPQLRAMVPRAGNDDEPVVQQPKLKRLKNVGEIQVLELHSDNPLISYKGRIFSGSWASNIGSELIFGAHDEVAERGLPHLRSLSGDVDLMAASSARILTTPADIRLKNSDGTLASAAATMQHHRRPAPDRYKRLRAQSSIEIPIAFDKHGFRKPQARFLENLMAIKRSRGEMDEVTTMTRDTTRDFVDRADDPEEASLQKKRARDRRRQKRLTEERASRPRKKRRGGNRWSKDMMVSFAESEGVDSGGQMEGETDGETYSRRTPKTWSELDGEGEGAGEEGGEAEGDGAEDVVRDSE